MMEIKLGDKVRCLNTGFTGTATSKMEFMNGCIQYEVVPRVGKDNKIPEGVFIDETSLEIIKPKKKPRIKNNNGGPNHASIKMRGY